MGEKIETKVKGFRIPIDLHKTLEGIIKDSGKEDLEWFKDLIHQIQTNELVTEKSGIPFDLRKHFGSDIAALKDATNLIQSIFVNQMNRVAVEKNNWLQLLQDKEKEFKDKQNALENDIQLLQEDVQDKESSLEDAHGTILQLQNKIEGFDKLEIHLRKDIERLEEEKVKLEKELLQQREESTLEKEKFYRDAEELKGLHKEEKDRLNQQIVDLVDKVKEVEPISEENKLLKDQVKELQNSLKRESADFEMRLTRYQEEALIDKEKALLMRERELMEQFYLQGREDNKELYEKIEKLQYENNRLLQSLDKNEERD